MTKLEESALSLSKSEGQTINNVSLTLSASVLPLPKADNLKDNGPIVAALASNLMHLGYVPHADLIKNWMAADYDAVSRTGTNVVRILSDMVGNTHLESQFPMYPNFPKQVAEADDAELLVNSLLHYLGDLVGLRITPAYEKLIRPALPEDEKLTKTLHLTSEAGLISKITTLLASSQAFSPAQRETLEVFLNLAPETFIASLPEDFANKENLGFVAARAVDHFGVTDETVILAEKMVTATDVLRFAVALSDGDVSLAEVPRFKSFSRALRRLMLQLIDVSSAPVEDMSRRREVFKRLGERLHPGEYAARYPFAAKSFALMRDENFVSRSFASSVVSMLNAKKVDTEAIVGLLSIRPGEFSRRLNEVLRTPGIDKEVVLDAWSHAAMAVSTTVLLQTHAYFKAEAEVAAGYREIPPRMFLPKGAISKAQVIKDTRSTLDQAVAASAMKSARAALIRRFSNLEELGKVFIDPTVKGKKVPFGVRSTSKALKTYARGSSFDFGDNEDTLRFFIHWRDLPHGGRVDIDLSASLLDSNFDYQGAVAYYDLRRVGIYHSGDFTSAPDGASEFIDVNIKDAVAAGNRYVTMVVHSYNGEPFNDVPDCFAGFMMRSEPMSGEIYEPSTVANKVDLTSPTTMSNLFLFDLEERKAYWVDVSRNTHVVSIPNNDRSTHHQSVNLLSAIMNNRFADLDDLFTMHVEARGGEVVKAREEADVVISDDEEADISPADVETILGDFVQ